MLTSVVEVVLYGCQGEAQKEQKMKNSKTVVWMSKHYNKFLRAWDWKLSCADDRFPPMSVYADDRKDAEDYCNQFLGQGNWELKETF